MYKILFLSIILLFNSCGKKPGIISSKEYGKFYTEGIKEKKWVAITFDDGPKPEVLDKILNALKKENIKATFFVVGMNMKLYPKYAKKYLVNGHEIGNHSMNHIYPFSRLSYRQKSEEIFQMHREAEDILQYRMPLLYPL